METEKCRNCPCSVSAEFDRWMEKLVITCNVGVMQKSALLGILRKLLEM